jgi:hypothetical protein
VEINLNNKSACLFGLPDSGKSTLAHMILSSYGSRAFCFDTMNEYPPDSLFDSYSPKLIGDMEELDKVTRRIMRSGKYDLYVIDEVNRYAKAHPHPLPGCLRDLNDFRAHYQLGVLYICRRPVQLHTDLVDLCNYMITFRMDGKHDVDYLNDTASGLGDAAAALEPFNFIVRSKQDGQIILHEPVDPDFATNKTGHAKAVNYGKDT